MNIELSGDIQDLLFLITCCCSNPCRNPLIPRCLAFNTLGLLQNESLGTSTTQLNEEMWVHRVEAIGRALYLCFTKSNISLSWRLKISLSTKYHLTENSRTSANLHQWIWWVFGHCIDPSTWLSGAIDSTVGFACARQLVSYELTYLHSATYVSCTLTSTPDVLITPWKPHWRS